jgi:hypothetical protein
MIKGYNSIVPHFLYSSYLLSPTGNSAADSLLDNDFDIS